MMVDDCPSLLVELGCEELPPKSLPLLASSFFEAVCAGLDEAGIPFDPADSRFFYTPRRLSIRLKGVPGSQPDQVLERKGPALSAAYDADGNPTRAATGFASSVGKNLEDLDTLKTEKGEWLYCKLHQAGKPLGELLFPILDKALSSLPVAKPMRWGSHSFAFVRPAHWLMVMHGSETLKGTLLGLEAGNTTRGHRIHSPGPHQIDDPEKYETILKSAFVIVCQEERKSTIRTLAKTSGSEAGGRTRIRDSLLEEVSNILEWPTAVLCRFDPGFLEVPEEALIASMEDHQKFFPVLDANSGSLTEYFVTMANLESREKETVADGFMRVIRPRLADARFFWEQDKKIGLEALQSKLDDVIFQKKIGSVGDKSRRLEAFIRHFGEEVGVDIQHACRAAMLCKCDLLTHMVGEFPELQGIMGGHYAHDSGEPGAVSAAISEHYRPRFSGDEIPETDEGAILSLADKLDTLVGVFAAGLKPTGNKDPFALRRAALGCGRILIEKRYPIGLERLFSLAASALSAHIEVGDQVLNDARDFLLERLRQNFRDQGVPTGVVNAVFAAPVGSVPDLADRIEAVAFFLQQAEAEILVAANKRIGNILRSADNVDIDAFDENVLVLDEERLLFDEIVSKEKELAPLMKSGDYRSALGTLTSLHTPVTAFFDHVLVMDEDPVARNNRLSLLLRMKSLFDRVADFTQSS